MKQHNTKKQQGFVGALIVLVLGAALIVTPVLIYRGAKLGSMHKETFTVTKLPNREQQYSADGSKNRYANLVYSNIGVYDNTDSIFPLKTRSSDLYNQLKVGKKYTCTVAGWRVGWLSWYKNLIDCDGFKYE